MDTENTQMVAKQGDRVIVMLPRRTMSTEEALRHAAWLVAITGQTEHFQKVLEAVLNT